MNKSYLFALLFIVLIGLTLGAVIFDRFPYDLAITRWVQSLNVDRVIGSSVLLYNGRLGIVGIAGGIGLGVIILLWLKNRRVEAASVAMVGVADLINPLFRVIIDRPRPTEDLVSIYYPDLEPFSFPSGTAMHITMFCGILVYLSGRLLKPGLLRYILQTLLVLYIPLMGLRLIYLGSHWPSDILGGYVYGGLFLWTIIWGHHRYLGWRRCYPSQQIPKEALPLLLRPFAPIFTRLR
ncbi:phosphatase PAP2 family protein [Chloroflexota bacterium]